MVDRAVMQRLLCLLLLLALINSVNRVFVLQRKYNLLRGRRRQRYVLMAIKNSVAVGIIQPFVDLFLQLHVLSPMGYTNVDNILDYAYVEGGVIRTQQRNPT